MIRVWMAVGRWLCGLFLGHRFELVIETQRLFVRCDDCGLATPGWRLDLPAPLAVNDRPVRRAGLLRVK